MTVLAACADQPTAPQPDVQSEAAAGKILVNFIADDGQSAHITVTPTGGVFELGPHAVYIPAYSICDPSTSSYGAGEWDKPCRALRSDIDIRAEIVNVGGQEQLFFTPSLRFVPSRHASRWVWIFMSTSGGVNSSSNILWTPFAGAPGVDESLTDHTLKTHFSAKLGIVYRRIKHFSGYQVSLGYAEKEPYGDEGVNDR